jgi:TRAP-type uncharacterized transport system substrate-binding protein
MPLPEDVRRTLMDRHAGLEPINLPIGRYTGQPDAQLPTLHQQVILVTDEKVGSEALTRFIVTTLAATAQIRKLDPHLAEFSANSALAPLPHLVSHPAVVRFRASVPNLARVARQSGDAHGAQ